MVQSAEDREVVTMLRERLERRRQFEIAPRLRDLPRHAVHAIWDVNEHAAPRLARSGGSACAQWNHRIEQRQRDGRAESAQEVTAIEKPVLGLDVAHNGLGVENDAPGAFWLDRPDWKWHTALMKTATWQLQDAKNRFSEVVERAR